MRKTFFTHLFIWSVVLGFAFTINAQDLSTSAGTSNSVELAEGGHILWDQTTNPGVNGAPSQYFPDFLGAGEAADDFIVPPGETWKIDSILIVGTYGAGTNLYIDLDVNIFADDGGGLPGALVFSDLGLVAGAGPIFSVVLSSTAILTEGTYWLNFMVNMNFVPDGQFFWSGSLAPVVVSEFAWRDTTNLFGTACAGDPNWNPGASVCGVGGGVDPDLQFVIYGTANTGLVCNEDFFDVDISNWTWIGPLGFDNWIWSGTNLAGGASPGELNFHWSPTFTGDSYLMSKVVISNGFTVDISFWSFIDWFADPMTVSVAWTTDDGATLNTIWEVIDPGGKIGPEFVQLQAPGDDNFRLVFCWSGDTFMIDEWWIDDVFMCFIIPVELTSFAAIVNDRNVTLNWTTATELNNQGFDVERDSGNGFEKIGFVAGFGTSTEIHTYSYEDGSLQEGSYSYRLKQVDFDGRFEYSDVVEVDVTVPKVFALEQNFPNPFNPSTMILFSLAVDSKVTLTVFDILGQEVANLISGNLGAGSHEVNFNASNINSGVYFYRIDASAVDGTSFSSIKKMILLK